MNAPLRGRTAIVTGAAGGMGRAHALRLAGLGADVAIFDVDLNVGRRWNEALTAASVVDEIRATGARGIAVEVDLTNATATQAAVEEVVEQWHGIDILVNNAGGAITPYDRSTPTTTSDDDARRVLEVNLLTTVNCCRACAPHLRRPGASIVNIATGGIDTEVPGGRLALYAASKAAVVRYTRSLALELGPDGIRANAIAPGYIETARIRALAASRPAVGDDIAGNIPLRRSGAEADVSAVVEFLTGDLSGYVTGECIRVNGGMHLTPPG
jgi:3-oxoacyl-[acyl-carrier protein] reductase